MSLVRVLLYGPRCRRFSYERDTSVWGRILSYEPGAPVQHSTPVSRPAYRSNSLIRDRPPPLEHNHGSLGMVLL